MQGNSYYVQFINTKEREYEMYQECKISDNYKQLVNASLEQAEFLKANVFTVDTVKILSSSEELLATYNL